MIDKLRGQTQMQLSMVQMISLTGKYKETPNIKQSDIRTSKHMQMLVVILELNQLDTQMHTVPCQEGKVVKEIVATAKRKIKAAKRTRDTDAACKLLLTLMFKE